MFAIPFNRFSLPTSHIYSTQRCTPAVNKYQCSLSLTPHYVGNFQNFPLEGGNHPTVKFTVRTGLFGRKGTHNIFAVGGPVVPE